MKDPLVSFFVLTYNQEKYIADAIDGAFAQDYPNMEIIISDDCSKDSTWDIVKEKVASYNGPHKIVMNRNETNLGPREHVNKALYELCQGDILIGGAGDDVSMPERTRICVEFMMKNPEVMTLCCGSQVVDENLKPISREYYDALRIGNTSIYTLQDFVEFNEMYCLYGESRVFRRKVIDAFPPLKYSYAEDTYLFIRSLYIGSTAYIRQPLVLYRQHEDSIMGKSRKRDSSTQKPTKKDIEYFKNVMVRQIDADYNYAVEHQYFNPKMNEYVYYKLRNMMSRTIPQWRSPIYRILRKINKRIARLMERHDLVREYLD